MSITTKLLPIGAAALIGGGGGALVATTVADPSSTTTVVRDQSAPAGRVQAVADTSSSALTPRAVYERSKGSVAFVTARVSQPGSDPFGGSGSGTATGSAFVVSSAGYLVTNAHVVDNATSVKVKIGDGKSRKARVVGEDASTDIALLKVDAAGDGLLPLEFGDSAKIRVGDPTYAIGNPFGLDRTLTTGVVSALRRQISAPNGFSIDKVVQTDAALNPGNSGGPLLDSAGRVIGVNSQIESNNSNASGQGSNSGIGFAVPSDTVRTVVAQLKGGGKVSHAYLGVRTSDAPSGGARVGAITDRSPAREAGLRVGDVITRFAGKAVEDGAGLASLVNDAKPGDEVKLTVRREGDERTVAAKLGDRPATASVAAEPALP